MEGKLNMCHAHLPILDSKHEDIIPQTIADITSLASRDGTGQNTRRI